MKKSLPSFALIAVVAIAAFSACSPGTPSAPPTAVSSQAPPTRTPEPSPTHDPYLRVRLLVTVDTKAMVPGSRTISPDLQRVAYVEQEGGEQYLVIDGQEQKRYDRVGFPRYSPDSAHIAYVAIEGSKGFVVLDGQEGQQYEFDPAALGLLNAPAMASILNGLLGLTFSPDSKRIAYVAGREKKYFAVIDGKEGPPYDAVGLLQFSPDSGHSVYVATDNLEKFVVADGVEGKHYKARQFDPIENLQFSADGSHLAYSARVNRDWFVVLDGHEFDEYPGAGGAPGYVVPSEIQGGLQFSPDGRHWAFSVNKGGLRFAVVDGEEGQGYGSCCSQLQFSPDSQHVAYVAADGPLATAGTELFVVADGHKGKPYANIRYLQFSANSQRLVYEAQTVEDPTGESFVVVDGQEGKPYLIYGVFLSPDGRHVAQLAMTQTKDIKAFVVLDGREEKQYDPMPAESTQLESIVFSPDSQHTAHVTQVGDNKAVVWDGSEGTAFRQVFFPPQFSPDSQHIAYIAQEGDEKSVVHDMQEGKAYSAIKDSRILFSPDGQHFAYVGIEDGKEHMVVDTHASEAYDFVMFDEHLFDTAGTFHYLAGEGDKILWIEDRLP